jgi:stage II sporulation protein D
MLMECDFNNQHSTINEGTDAMHRLGLMGLLLAFLLAPAGCGPNYQRPAGNVPAIRVRLLSSQQQVTFSASAPPTVISSGDDQPRRLEFPGGVAVPVTLSPSGWRIGQSTFVSGVLTLQPEVIGSLKINGAPYRGSYRLVPVADDKFDVINDVDVESYLMSVVSSEMLRDWHIEAYKAQAIAARTYVLFEARTASANAHFDVEDDSRSQVYTGLSGESDRSRDAVLGTMGVVLAFGPPGEERIFKAYFSSCCGGIGQSAYDVFGEADIPPLREKNVGNQCNASPRFNWGPVVIKKDELTRRIRAWGARRNRPEKDIGQIARIEVASLNRYRRPVRFIITDARGQQYSLSGEETRTACNMDAKDGPTLYSSFVTPVSEPQAIRFVEGHGWGHAVGLCQWCCQSMALRGKSHEQILNASYPQSVRVRAY